MNLDSGSTMGDKGLLTAGNHGIFGNPHNQYAYQIYYSKTFTGGDVNNYVKIFETMEFDSTTDYPQLELVLRIASIGVVNDSAIDGTIKVSILGSKTSNWYNANYYCERLGSTGYPGIFVLNKVTTTGNKYKFIGYIKIQNTNQFRFIPLITYGTKYFYAYSYQQNEPKTTKYVSYINLDKTVFTFFDELTPTASLEGTTVVTSITENSTNITNALSSSITTSGGGATSITITNNTQLVMLGYTSDSTIKTITGGYTGQKLTLVGTNANCALNTGGNVILANSATSRAMANNKSVTLIKMPSNAWLEITNNFSL